MDNKRSPKCWIGLHVYTVYKELNLTDHKENIVGLIIINRCNCCGKIKHHRIRTIETHI